MVFFGLHENGKRCFLDYMKVEERCFLDYKKVDNVLLL